MAVFVLLEVTDEKMAKGFVRAIVGAEAADPNMKVWGVFKKPTQFCACDGSGKKTATAYTRGLKYGWWVHRVCMKPTAKWASGAQWFSVVGTNLLPRSLRPYPEEMSPSLESPAAWNDLVSKGENSDVEA
jgi:hypothetical protein